MSWLFGLVVMQIILFSNCGQSLSHNSLGRHLQCHHKTNARINTIFDLQQKRNAEPLNVSQSRALAALLRNDTYESKSFTPNHRAFKIEHNNVFSTLSWQCSNDDGSIQPLFYLDGKDGDSTNVLLKNGWSENGLHVANMFQDSCDRLRNSFKDLNIHFGLAEDVLLSETLQKKQFVGYYLDGCGGATAPILKMLDAIFSQTRKIPRKITIGITLTEAVVTGRSLADREQDCSRHLAGLCRTSGRTLEYVGDNPAKFGLSSSPPRRDQGTQTTWFVCSIS